MVYCGPRRFSRYKTWGKVEIVPSRGNLVVSRQTLYPSVVAGLAALDLREPNLSAHATLFPSIHYFVGFGLRRATIDFYRADQYLAFA